MSRYVYIWIEGLTPKKGEKIKSISPGGHITYTTKMMEAMRIERKNIDMYHGMLRTMGIAEWSLKTAFKPTNYAPKGTLAH